MAKRGGLVLVSGFARKNGVDSAEFLKNLSLARARNVSKYLAAKGVRVSVRYEGYGAVTKKSERVVSVKLIFGGSMMLPKLSQNRNARPSNNSYLVSINLMELSYQLLFKINPLRIRGARCSGSVESVTR